MCAPQMLQQGFDCEQADYDGRTALMLAAAKGHTGVVRLLLAAKADVNGVQSTHIHVCATLTVCQGDY